MLFFMKKVLVTLKKQYKERGLYLTLLMNLSQLTGVLRAMFYRMLYMRNIKAGLFTMQAGSKLELFHPSAKVSIGSYVFIRKNTSIRIDHEGELIIGDKVFINDNCNINCVSKTTIGPYTKIAPNVSINDHDHNFRSTGEGHLLKGDVTIGEHVWIGSHTVILRGSVIGDRAVIAAGSVVKGHVPAGTVFMNPRERVVIAYNPSQDKEVGTV